MAMFEYGEYKIDIDEMAENPLAETRYAKNNFNDQIYRNLKLYADKEMSSEEKQLFNALGIDFSKPVDCFGDMEKRKGNKCFVGVDFSVLGKCLAFPKPDLTGVDDEFDREMLYYETFEENRIDVGNFKVSIMPMELFADTSKTAMPVFISVTADAIPWLLNEKYKSKKCLKFIEHLKRRLSYRFRYIITLVARKKERTEYMEKLQIELENLKKQCSLDYEIMDTHTAKEYRKQWIDNLLPVNTNKKIRQQAYDVCLLKLKCDNCLWHLFSYEFVDTIENPTEEFNKQKKRNCTLVLDCCGNICVKLKNAENLTEQDIIDLCNRVSGWCDFVITADDFSWAYSRTHEDGWLGPYFYKKNSI